MLIFYENKKSMKKKNSLSPKTPSTAAVQPVQSDATPSANTPNGQEVQLPVINLFRNAHIDM